MKKAVILIMIIGLSATAFWFAKDNNKQNSIPSIKTIKHIKYSFTVQNKTNQLVNDKKMWVYAPVEKNSFQTCSIIETNIPFIKIKSKNENQVLALNISELPPYATRVINLQTDVSYSSTPQKTDLIKKDAYLLPEHHIESNHPDIIVLAKKLKANKVIETAKNIYDWVSLNIEYAGHIKNSRGALYALQKRKGDCTEFMSLFIALCRANNIPARGIGGYTCTGDCRFDSSGYHNWAQFYVKGSWLIADCQKKVFNKNNTDYIAMQVLSGDKDGPMKGFSRFNYQGTGLSVKMN